MRHDPLGEADKILTLYTPYLGKLRIVAKGVRRPRSRLAGHVEPLTRSAMMIAQGRNLDILSQSHTIDSFVPLKEDLARTSQAIYAAELLGLFTVEEDANSILYQGFLATLEALCGTSEGALVLRRYELQLLDILGYRPELDSCISCNDPIGVPRAYFSPSGGGVVCPGCRSGEASVRPISDEALKVLQHLREADLRSIDGIRASASLSREVEAIMRGYIRYLLEREVKSTAFLDTLRRQPLASTVGGAVAWETGGDLNET